MTDTIIGVSKDKQDIKDQIYGRDESLLVFINAGPYVEELNLEEGATIVKKRSFSAGGGDAPFILGDSAYGVLGTSKLGAGDVSTFVTVRIANPNNIYTERFYDTTFKDSTNTTATWDTTNNQITF